MYRLWDNVGLILILKLLFVGGHKTLLTVFGIHHRFYVCVHRRASLPPMK